MTNQPPDYTLWLHKANHDLDMAKRAMIPDAPLPDMACYHAQQCAEKCLKAFLVAKAVVFAPVHDLLYLTQLCMGQEESFQELLSAMDVLNEYASRVRYPVEEELEPDEPEAREAITCAETIRNFVLGLLSP